MTKIAYGVYFRFCACLFCALFYIAFSQKSIAADKGLLELSFEDLMQVKISSVARREQLVSDAAASIYVITSEAIRNSGVTTLPEALRLDPRLQVSRITAAQYAVGVRGFTTDTNNKMLVLIDGRTVYTSLFSGVFWDHQDVMLEDIERIEVISGPGATLWGTNAVNGVINIITRESSDTQGWLGAVHGGDVERGARIRYGNAIGEQADLRIYGKFFHTDGRRLRNGEPINDGAERAQVGFRTDWKSNDDHVTLQGDAYTGRGDDRGIFPAPWLGGNIALEDVRPSGSNLLARWHRTAANGSDFRLQAYWDYFKRRDAFLFQSRSDTFDIELQNAMPMGRHRIMWGTGYRRTDDETDNGVATYFLPANRSLEWMNVFSMADLHITDTFTTTLGLRLEHNQFTGMEYLPSVRATWKPSPEALIWTSLSRAVRAPARFDRDVYYGFGPQGPWIVAGGPDFESEVANVLEIGYRGQNWDKLSYSITAYYHDWDKLRSASSNAIPIQMANNIEGGVYGAHFWANLQILSRWQLSTGGAYLQKDLHLKPGSTDPVGVSNPTLANDAEYYGQIRSTMELTTNSTLQISLRHVAQLKNQQVPAYSSIDVHYAWQFRPDMSLSFTVESLADREHYEYGEQAAAVIFDRSARLALIWEP